jgi:hypothetical protein
MKSINYHAASTFASFILTFFIFRPIYILSRAFNLEQEC